MAVPLRRWPDAGERAGARRSAAPITSLPTAGVPTTHAPMPCCPTAGESSVVLHGLRPGVYYYKFVVDGNWAIDPIAPKVRAGVGHTGFKVES